MGKTQGSSLSHVISLRRSVCFWVVGLIEGHGHLKEASSQSHEDPLCRTDDILGSIAQLLNVSCRDVDISTAHRLQGRKGDRGPPCSVLYLTRCENVLAIGEEEEGFYDGTRASKFLPQTPIYLNEHLTPQSRAIFNGARALVKQGKLSTVWTSDSKVMAKLTPDHRPSVSGTSSISPN
ncbi:hypothetical protein J6590_105512 [Homalodisca vitripennis]|nr:hypothetical protein J6590_105512 [Homalodisca vitripennis]